MLKKERDLVLEELYSMEMLFLMSATQSLRTVLEELYSMEI